MEFNGLTYQIEVGEGCERLQPIRSNPHVAVEGILKHYGLYGFLFEVGLCEFVLEFGMCVSIVAHQPKPTDLIVGKVPEVDLYFLTLLLRSEEEDAVAFKVQLDVR